MRTCLWYMAGVWLAGAVCVFGDNIDPLDLGEQYAYCENAGWVNFEPDGGEPDAGGTVTSEGLSGFVWAENIGWINLRPCFGGVENDGTGLLRGFAWGENVGWINFGPEVAGDPNHYGVTIDDEGDFGGWAWGENIGWIHFGGETGGGYGLRTSWVTDCVVGAEDLAAIAEMWMLKEDAAADLDGSGSVDLVDYGMVAELWLKRCPAGWPLKEE